jgi:hypothetical protein
MGRINRSTGNPGSKWFNQVLTTFYLNVQLLDCTVSIPDRVLEEKSYR